MIFLNGTLPVIYNQVEYYIPVNILIQYSYPYVAPLIYVTPKQNMVITPRHTYVDTTGKCYLPYLNEWNAQCNLVSLAQSACIIFGINPPVRSTVQKNPPPYSTKIDKEPKYNNPFEIQTNENNEMIIEESKLSNKEQLVSKLKQKLKIFLDGSTQEIEKEIKESNNFNDEGFMLKQKKKVN